MVRHVLTPRHQFGLGRQVAIEQQIGRLDEGALLGQLFDRVSPISQDALAAVDEGDRAPAGCRVEKSRVVGHQPEIVRVNLDLPEIHARIVPSVIGISYCFPVRLSVIVSVSAMSVESAREVRSQESGKPRSLGEGGRALPPVRSGPVRLVVVVGIGHGRGLSSHPIPPVLPVPEVEQLAPFAAEWPPLRRDRPCPAVYADRMTDHDQCVGV